ncbi:DoxX family protein [Flagellimonas lutimaris]|uniref:DoxX family protein n=1 Tax=Flagellimonas lutimaris TaxID=475082 RepID=UPI003F5CD5AB
MNQKRNRLIYFIATGLLTAIMLMSAGMYFFNYEVVSKYFGILGYPTYIIYPLAIAKVLGLIAIWAKKSDTLKEWAYAGFFFDSVLALSAHLYVNDGGYTMALAAAILVIVSSFFEKKQRIL